MRVLFLTQTSELGPSSRYRVYQLLPALRKLGIEGDVSPAIGGELYSDIYLAAGGLRSRRSGFQTIWRKRQADMQQLRRYDAVVVQKGVLPGLYSGFERKIARQKPLVFDFDDAVWLPRQGGSPLLRMLHREGEVQDICRRARAIIAGNEYLGEYARRFNHHVAVVPSVVDVSLYTPQRGRQPLVGWIGSRTTLPYLLPLKPVFERLGIIPRVIASGDPAELGFSVEFRPWRLETEIRELQQIGIGIAPLPDTPWERGKCGVKLLQYMACGIPVVASAVGVHREIIRHGENGLLATTEKDWHDALHELQHQPALREKLGHAARRTVEERFDIPAAAQKVASVLKNLKA